MDPLMTLFQGMLMLAAGALAGLCAGIGALPVFVVMMYLDFTLG